MRALRNFKPDRCYHLISRIANRAFYLTDEERTRFVERLWRVAKFSGIEVLAHCFMSNHFHLLVHLPEATGGAARGTGDLQRQLLHGALPGAACKSWVHCRRRYREPSFAAAEVSACGQGKEVGLASYSTTLTPPLGTDPSRFSFRSKENDVEPFEDARNLDQHCGSGYVSRYYEVRPTW